MSTKTELEEENDALREENGKLMEQNKALAEQLAALAPKEAPPPTPIERPITHAHGTLAPTDGRDGVTRDLTKE